MDAAVPAVEVADDADPDRVRRPDGEMHAGDAADLQRMRAELLVDAGVVALAEQVHVEVGEDPPEAVGILDLDAVTRPGTSPRRR